MRSRLTNDMRQAISEAAVAHAFNPRRDELKKTEDQLAREAFACIFSAKEIEAVSKIPENWFRLDDCLKFNVGGQSITLRVEGQGLRVPYRAKGSANGGWGCNNLGSIPHGDLCDRIQKHAQAFETYKEERRNAARVTMAMLNAVNTTKRLREVWPEGLQFFVMYEGEERQPLPAVRVDEINQILGLQAACLTPHRSARPDR